MKGLGREQKASFCCVKTSQLTANEAHTSKPSLCQTAVPTTARYFYSDSLRNLRLDLSFRACYRLDDTEKQALMKGIVIPLSRVL